jgi:hypothetical protein
MIPLIILGVAAIIGGGIILLLVILNDSGGSTGGDPVQRFFKKSALAYWGAIGAVLVVSGIGSIVGATQLNKKPAAGQHK